MDKFLKVSRLIKRRTVAKEAAMAERIEVNGRTAKPSAEVKQGDVLTLHFGNRMQRVEVLSTDERVGKQAAAMMYRQVGEEHV